MLMKRYALSRLIMNSSWKLLSCLRKSVPFMETDCARQSESVLRLYNLLRFPPVHSGIRRPKAPVASEGYHVVMTSNIGFKL